VINSIDDCFRTASVCVGQMPNQSFQLLLDGFDRLEHAEEVVEGVKAVLR
jgi:hypothetical protein